MAIYFPNSLSSFVLEPRLVETKKPNLMGGALEHGLSAHTPIQAGPFPRADPAPVYADQVLLCRAVPA